MITVGVYLPGMGLRISNMIIQLSGGSLVLATLIIFGLAYVLGMGLSLLPAYVILATLAAPALINLGAPFIGSHFLVLWWAQITGITPPVCLSLFVACALAKSPLWPSSIEALKKACMVFIIPWLFIYDPLLLLDGSLIKISLRVGIIVVAIIVLQAGLVGYFYRHNKIIDTILLLIGGALLLIPHFSLNIAAGFTCIFSVFLLQAKGTKLYSRKEI